MASFIKDRAKVVVGVDYSQNSNDALEAAASLATASADVTIHLVHVTKPSGTQPFAGMTRPFVDPADAAQLEELQVEKDELEALAQRTISSGVASGAQLFGHLRTGNPAREIIQLASDLSADLIVVGTHGRTGVMKLLLGSVAQTVLTNASCPVLVVKPKGFPLWPAIEPPCTDCLAVQQSSNGQRLWCERHSKHHPSAHTHSEHPDSYGHGAQTFRGLD